MNVEVLAQLFAVHRRTFNVPARTAVAPRGWPAWFTLFRHLPQHEVHRVALHINHVNAGTGLELIQILTGKRTVGWVRRHGEHHVAVVGNVRMSADDQLFGDLDDFVNMVGRARLAVRTQNIQGVEVFVHLSDHAIHQRDKAFAVFIGALDDLIVDVGDVAHVFQLVPQKTQVA